MADQFEARSEELVESEEGGFKGSGQGRMRGVAVIDDFIEYKHIAFAPGITGTPK
jgi:hypothetical protein